jgi:hypothetical protein
MSYAPRKFGRGVRRVPGQMNGWERKYASHLEGLKQGGVILDYWFDAMKLRLAPKTFYEIDFLILMADSTLEVHEVKGHWEDDARVKIKVAADKFPMRFKAIRLEKGAWVVEEI